MTRRRLAATLAGSGLLLALLGGSPLRAQSPPPDRARTLHVFAAASLADAFGAIGRALERQRPGLTVRINLAGSQQLATQIEQGAAADVFASADERWMRYLEERGRLAGESTIFARNRLVAIVPRTNPARIRGLADLARGGVKLVLGADAVPVGRYSRIALQNLARDPAFGPDFAARALRNLVSEEESVKSVVGKVQLGEADAGIVYRSDVTPAAARVLRVIEIPASANVIASYPIALVKDAADAESGRAFIALVLAPEGQRLLARGGLIPAAAPTP